MSCTTTSKRTIVVRESVHVFYFDCYELYDNFQAHNCWKREHTYVLFQLL
jgi:hypothetical protein